MLGICKAELPLDIAKDYLDFEKQPYVRVYMPPIGVLAGGCVEEIKEPEFLTYKTLHEIRECRCLYQHTIVTHEYNILCIWFSCFVT